MIIASHLTQPNHQRNFTKRLLFDLYASTKHDLITHSFDAAF
jgi:hypothetical protein